MELYATFEYTNILGSVKDRTGFCILKDGIEKGDIHQNPFVTEASCGNFAVSLTCMCHILGLKCVVAFHPGFNQVDETRICRFVFEGVVVDNLGAKGSYLLTKIEAVEKFLMTSPNSFRTNQYENPMNTMAHYHGTGYVGQPGWRGFRTVFLKISHL